MRNKEEKIYRKFALIGIILIAIMPFSILIHAITAQEENWSPVINNDKIWRLLNQS